MTNATTAQLAYLEEATPEHPVAYHDRAKMAQEAHVVLDVYVPKPGDPFSAIILPGSAIVGLLLDYDPDRTLVYYEGGKFTQMTFAEKLIHAVDRMVVRYPTVAAATPKSEALMKVGTYDVATKELHIEDQETLDTWLDGVA